jgi:hypothetical protein
MRKLYIWWPQMTLSFTPVINTIQLVNFVNNFVTPLYEEEKNV